MRTALVRRLGKSNINFHGPITNTKKVAYNTRKIYDPNYIYVRIRTGGAPHLAADAFDATRHHRGSAFRGAENARLPELNAPKVYASTRLQSVR